MSNLQPVRRALVIAGMHRSGTSALTRTMNLLGASLPSELLQLDPSVPNETNELGFWEGVQVNTINNEFLSSIGSGWDDASHISDATFRSDLAIATRNRIVRHLEAEFGDKPFFVLKDPRIARLAPLWIDALKAFGAELNFIIPIRNPLEVAGSLLKRDGMGRGQATLLWLRYMLDAERHSRNFQRSFVAYDGLLENWRKTAREIAKDCDFEWSRFNVASEVEIDNFLSSERRHNSALVAQVEELPIWMRDTYNLFLDAVESKRFDSVRADQILGELERADSVYGRYICELNIGGLNAERNKLGGELGDVLSEKALLQERLDETVRNMQAESAKFDAAQSDRDHMIASLKARLGELETANLAIPRMRLRLDELNDSGDVADRRISDLQEEVRITLVLLATERKLTQAASKSLRVAQESWKRGQFKVEMNLSNQLADARNSLRLSEAKIAELQGLKTFADQLISSRSWKITKPIRFVMRLKIVRFLRSHWRDARLAMRARGQVG
ncbi:MAG: hypothetical protein WA840_12205 [Caulobacteraceae bacterium]